MNQDWLAVFDALNAVYTDGAYSNISINEAVSRRTGCRESFVRTFAKGTVRDTIKLDHIIGVLAEKGLGSIRRRPLIILRMGIYAIGSLGSVPDHAAVSEAVSLAKGVAKGNDRFINAMLRSYIRRRSEFDPSAMEEHLRYSFSEPVFSLLKDHYGEEACDIAEALNRPPELFLRVNTLKAGRDEVLEKLHVAGIRAESCDENSEAIRAFGSGIASGRLYREGLITIQSLSSMMAVKSFCPAPGSKVLDLCAAPGGKTGYMAELMHDRGSITACDVHPHRVELTEANMKRIGAGSVRVRRFDASCYEASFDSAFDYVLADVPCSGLGVIAGKPEIKLTSDPASYGGLIEIQEKILENAIRYAKPGGRIMYSTCTLNKDENESVVKHVLSRASCLCGIVEMDTLLPYNGKVGFFYCIMEKMTN